MADNPDVDLDERALDDIVDQVGCSAGRHLCVGGRSAASRLAGWSPLLLLVRAGRAAADARAAATRAVGLAFACLAADL